MPAVSRVWRLRSRSTNGPCIASSPMTSTCSSGGLSFRPGSVWQRLDIWELAPPAPPSPRRSHLRAGPYPHGATHEHQRKPEGQVLDRRVGNATVTDEHDVPRTQDGLVAVADDAATCQPAVGDQLKAHDDAVCRPPGSRPGERRPQQDQVRKDRDQHGNAGRDGIRGHADRRPSRTTFTASNVRMPARGITTKNAYSSRGSPHNRMPNVWAGSNCHCPELVARRSHVMKTTATSSG